MRIHLESLLQGPILQGQACWLHKCCYIATLLEKHDRPCTFSAHTDDELFVLPPSSMLSLHGCRAAATTRASGGDSNEKLQLQLRQAQQMAAAVARKKDDMLIKLKRLTYKQVLYHVVLDTHQLLGSCLYPALHDQAGVSVGSHAVVTARQAWVLVYQAGNLAVACIQHVYMLYFRVHVLPCLHAAISLQLHPHSYILIHMQAVRQQW